MAHAVTDQPMVLVVPEAEVETDAAAICARNPILVYDRASWGGQIAWAALTALCDPLDIRCELDALETIATEVEALEIAGARTEAAALLRVAALEALKATRKL